MENHLTCECIGGNKSDKFQTIGCGGIMKKIMIMGATLFYGIATAQADSISQAATLLKELEGFRATTYIDVEKRAIGYGFSSEKWTSKGRITEEEASAELTRICTAIAEKVRAEIGKETLTPAQEAAIISFVYNVGWNNFVTSSLCKKLKEGYRGAVVGVEFKKWVYITKGGKKVRSKGLDKRRIKEVHKFLIG